MTATERELIDEKFRGVYTRLDTNNELIHQQLKQILKIATETKIQATKTNGRMTTLEHQTVIGRWFQRHPTRYLALFFPYLFTIKEIRDLVFVFLSLK